MISVSMCTLVGNMPKPSDLFGISQVVSEWVAAYGTMLETEKEYCHQKKARWSPTY